MNLPIRLNAINLPSVILRALMKEIHPLEPENLDGGIEDFLGSDLHASHKTVNFQSMKK
jgi:hypothetical protein